MTAMSLYLAEARMAELRESRLRSGRAALSALLSELAQIARGVLTPTGGSGAGLSPALRRDMGLM